MTSASAPRFAVVLIVLDGERFLAEAIDSVLAQSVEDWELVVVDDGSRDATPKIIAEYESRDPRVRGIAHADRRNLGMSASRNAGVAATCAARVVLLDHDDAFEPRKLEVLGALLDERPEAMAAFGPNLRWRSWRPGSDEVDLVQDLGAASGMLPPPGTLPVFLTRSDATPLGPMLRREAFESVGGYDPAFRGMHEDQAFFARLMLRHPIALCDEVLHRYRMHEDSCVAAAHRSGTALAARRRYLDWLEEELERSPRAGDAELRAAIVAARPSRRAVLSARLHGIALSLKAGPPRRGRDPQAADSNGSRQGPA